MSKNTNLSFLTDFLTADIVNTRVGINNASPQTTLDVTGTGKFSGILTLGSTVSNGTNTYTLPSATGTLALTSDIPSVSGYVPYTGATSSLDVGTNDLLGRYLNAEGSGGLGGVLNIKQDAVYLPKGNGYSSIASSFTDLDFFAYTGASTYKNFTLKFDELTDNTRRRYTLPDTDGTLALTSNLDSYVTLNTTQTITGSKTFNLDILVNGVNVGRGAGSISTNTRVGTNALTNNTTGSSNTGVGLLALGNNSTGARNTSLGESALVNNTTGDNNVAFGVGAGVFLADGSSQNSITNNSVFIGVTTRSSANNQTNQIVIGHNATGNGSNTVTLGNDSITSTYLKGTVQLTDTGTASSINIISDSIGNGAIHLTKNTTGTGIRITNNGVGDGILALNNSTGSGITIGNISTGKGLIIANAADATGDPFVYTLGGAAFVKAKIDYLGNFTAVGGTLTGALNGTSASFSGAISLANNNIFPTGAGIFHGNNGLQIVSGSTEFTVNNNANTAVNLRILNTGAATFSSSVTANAGTFSIDTAISSGDAFVINSSAALSAAGAFGAGLIFTGVGSSGRRAAIVPVQGTADNDTLGLAFFTHGSAVGSNPLAEAMRITSAGNVLIGTTTDNGAKLQIEGRSTMLDTLKINASTTTSVSTSATIISTANNTYGGLAIVWGSDAVFNIWTDLLFYSLGQVFVIRSQDISGGPFGRTYTTNGSGALLLSMGGGTYTIRYQALLTS